jgi:hypothetical protein
LEYLSTQIFYVNFFVFVKIVTLDFNGKRIAIERFAETILDLINNKIKGKIILVLDGASLPAKSNETSKRNKKRKKHRHAARKIWKVSLDIIIEIPKF